LESMLSRAGFQRPIPKSTLNMDFNSTGWDADIVRANALLACAIIIDRKEPESELADRLYRRVWDSENSTGLIWNYIKGDFKFSFEPVKQDYVGQIIPVSESTTGRIYLSGYGVSLNYSLRVKISTAGAVETAKFDISYDNGASYEITGVYTQFYYQQLFENIYIRFEGTFTEGEEWQIKVRPESEEMRSSINNIVIQRN